MRDGTASGMRKGAWIAIVALMMALPAWAQTKVDETRPLAADGVVEISNVAGSVQVLAWSGSGVEITGVLGKDVKELDISGTDRRLEIEVDLPRNADDIDTELVIRVPATAGVEVQTVSATIQVEGVEGAIDLESVNGRIEVLGRPSELSAESVSGDITVAFAPRRSDLATVSGSITVADGEGEIDAETVSGGVKVEGGLFDGASFETVSGSIIFAADLAPRGEYDFESMSGNVTLVVPASVSAEFDISTFSGSVSNALGPEPERTSKYTPEKELRFTAGSGGAEVSIESFSGRIEIKTR